MSKGLKIPGMGRKSSSGFDFRSLQKYFTPHAADDLNRFLEKMPVNVGQTMLMVAAVAWMSAGAIGLYTTVQLQQIAEMKAELEEASALQPPVPTIRDKAVRANELKSFADKIKDTYYGIKIEPRGSSITLVAPSTGNFGEWREAVGHIHNGGIGWRVKTENMCVGRECQQVPLSITLKVNKVDIVLPEL